jgi:hypothetical protein
MCIHNGIVPAGEAIAILRPYPSPNPLSESPPSTPEKQQCTLTFSNSNARLVYPQPHRHLRGDQKWNVAQRSGSIGWLESDADADSESELQTGREMGTECRILDPFGMLSLFHSSSSSLSSLSSSWKGQAGGVSRNLEIKIPFVTLPPPLFFFPNFLYFPILW